MRESLAAKSQEIVYPWVPAFGRSRLRDAVSVPQWRGRRRRRRKRRAGCSFQHDAAKVRGLEEHERAECREVITR